MDDESIVLIARLHLQDIEAVQAGQKGKSREDAPIPDEQCALLEQARSLEALLQAVDDRRLACSMDAALGSDQIILHAFDVAEKGAEDDRRAALTLSCGGRLPIPSAAQSLLERLPLNLGDKYSPQQQKITTRDLLSPGAQSISSNLVCTDATSLISTSRGVQEDFTNGESLPGLKSECIICFDRIVPTTSFHAPCGHYYCQGCLVSLVEASTRDQSLFPVRCCKQPFNIDILFPYLKMALISLFLTKSAEFSTPAGDRVYCANATCSKFLGASKDLSTDITCPDCRTSICLSCRNISHPRSACVENTDVLQLKGLAKTENWQTCPGCKAIVELSHGCHHITCRCNTQFCYVCALLWKKCKCPQWDESRLLDAAQRRVENELGDRAAVAQPRVFERQVQRRVEELRVNHDCFDHRWRYRRGGGQCNECSYTLSVFLLRCVNCQMLACVRCTRNRL